MPILTQKALVLVKAEVTQGTDSVPDETNDAILVSDPVFSVDPTVLERNFARPDFSPYASTIGRKLASISFSIQMHGSGTSNVSPIWARLLAACAMVETEDAGVSPSIWAPTTTPQSSVTIYCYYEGLLHRLTGCMGTFSINAEAGNIAEITFTMTGNYNTPQDSTFPASPTYQDVVAPQVELASLAYGGDSTLVVNAFSADIANNVVPRSDVNSANGYRGVRISGRDPTGGIDPEVEEDDTFWAQMEASTLSAFTATIGGTTGNRIVLAAPQAQITSVGYGDRDGLRTFDLGLNYRRNTGDDELTITFS